MSEELNGQAALVTGAGRGIGAAIALRLAQDGADVAITYVSNAGAARATADTITRKTGRRALAVHADAADAASVEAAVERTVQELGGLHIVVNNAGQSDLSLPSLEEMSVEAIDRMLAVNVRGALLTVRAAAPHLPDGGRVINIGSCLGDRVTGPGFAVYAASKAAVTGMTKALARDLGPRGITVNEVAPGPTDTEMNPQDGPGAEFQKGLTPFHRFAAPEEVASAVAYLASPRAAFVSAARLGVDGGGTA